MRYWLWMVASAPWAGEFAHVGGIECREFADCLAAVPEGRVVAAMVYLADMRDYPAMNAMYEKRFTGLKPARNTVEMKLRPGLRMAMEVTLYRGAGEVKGWMPAGVVNAAPITPGVVAGGKVFLAGILGRDSNAGRVPEGQREQVEMCFRRLRNVLQVGGLGMEAMVEARVFYTARMERALVEAKIQEIWGEDAGVAITLVEVPALALGANVAVSGIAYFLPTGG